MIKPERIIEVGTRSVCKEELARAKNAGVDFLTSQEIIKRGLEQIAEQLEVKLSCYDYM